MLAYKPFDFGPFPIITPLGPFDTNDAIVCDGGLNDLFKRNPNESKVSDTTCDELPCGFPPVLVAMFPRRSTRTWYTAP